MVIYEVNLTIEGAIYAEFVLWLKEHAKEMLQFPGFIQASFLKLEQNENVTQEQLTIQYHLKSRQDLESYFKDFAPQMQAAGIKRFNNKFSAKRSIYTIQETILKNIVES